MRLIRKFFKALLIIPGLMLGSCQEFLDQPPTHLANSDSFYKTTNDIQSAIMGCYNGLQGIYNTNQSGGIFIFGDLPSDIGEVQHTQAPVFNSINDFVISTDNLHIEAFWNNSYNTLSRANMILDRIDGVEMDGTLRTQLIAEVRFIRALVYFNLVRVFGGVPLVTREVSIGESYNFLRETPDKVYLQIINDLTFAREYLPPFRIGNQIGRTIASAATGILAKVYLTLERYSEARDLLKAIIDEGRFSLTEQYSQVFGIQPVLVENIFAIYYAANQGNLGSRFHQVFMPLGSIQGLGQGFCVPTPQFANSFEAGDTRRDFMIVSNLPGSIIPGSYGCFKYRDPTGASGDGNSNWIVLRYADVLLMYAEAQNKIQYGENEAFVALNLVRSRAGLPGLSPDDLPSQALFDRAVEDERKFELAFEGHRWFDLVRRKRAIEVINNERNHSAGIRITENNLLFPIPISVINTNSRITQNPGYFN